MFSELVSDFPSPQPLPGDPLPVAIAGAGFSGTIVASLLARSGQDVLLIDGSGKVGKGTAYSTEEPSHLLNVPAGRMSAFVGDPDDFADAIAAEGGDRTSFAPRRRYGEYLKTILDEAVASGRVEPVSTNAVAAERNEGCWTVTLDDGRKVRASALVLAMGNAPPAPLPQFADCGPGYVANPWGEEAAARVSEVAAQGGDVLLVGTGLTAVDVVLSLEAAGFAGQVVALSRRGQMPQSHGDFDPRPVELKELPSQSLLAMWRWLRQRSAEVGWRAAVDSLRNHSQALWQGFSNDDRRRFVRHARAWWDVRRHRLAPQVARTVDRLRSDGRLQVIAGRIAAARKHGNRIEVAVRRRGADCGKWRSFALVVNCTGPQPAANSLNPLLASLIEKGLVPLDKLGLGLAMDAGAKVAGCERLWAVGPLTKGRYWEITAVPDIRAQAAAVAGDIVEELKHERKQRSEHA